MQIVDRTPDFWRQSNDQLARACLRIAEGHFSSAPATLRAEAARIFLLWRSTLNNPCPAQEAREEQLHLLNALRKRTIQFLVRLTLTLSRCEAE